MTEVSWTPRLALHEIVRRNHWALAVALAGLLGLVEGALSVEGSDSGKIGPWTYWGILFSLPFIALLAAIGLARAVAHLPIVIVVQDWLSLVGQGKAPQSEFWYEAVFGSNFLTIHTAHLPNFYYIGFLVSVALHVGLDLHETKQRPTRGDAAAKPRRTLLQRLKLVKWPSFH